MIVGPHDEEAIFDGNADDQRPENQRETAQRRLAGKMSTGCRDDRLQRVERAGTEIAINNPERRERGRWRRLTSDARERRIVFVNNVGWHVPGLLAINPSVRMPAGVAPPRIAGELRLGSYGSTAKRPKDFVSSLRNRTYIGV